MKEAIFSTEVKSSLQDLGCWAYKIPDAVRGPATRFIPEKPFDIVASYRGTAFAIETKQIKKWQSFGRKDFRPSQLKELTRFQTQGQGRSFVMLNVRIPRKENLCIIFEWWAFENELKAEKALSVADLKEIAKHHSIVAAKGKFDFKIFLERYVGL